MVVGLVVRQEGAFFLTPNLTPERRQPGLVARTPLNTPSAPRLFPGLLATPRWQPRPDTAMPRGFRIIRKPRGIG